ncbi:MAG: IS21 family transposase [Deltaproteobacteria bacterium]|nr:MAG: IS21 family transposase [Deltaproteobacteria bacterium]RLC19774.1 MAG: IS21 family transposase [Deltaproteobacteria bacterium]
MNVLKPEKRVTMVTLLKKNISQHEISRKVGIDRKTIRKYIRRNGLGLLPENGDSLLPTDVVATGQVEGQSQNPPPRPPAYSVDMENIPFHARSACEPHRQWIEEQVRLGRNAMAIYQDLVERFNFNHKYNSVKRFVRKLKQKAPKQFDRLEFLPGEEAQVDYGKGALTMLASGRYRRPRLFVMTLKYSRRSFRKVVRKSSQEVWARLHEEAFRYFGGSVQYVVLDNLKEGVIKPDIYEPELNPVYEKMLNHYGVVADPARVRDPNRKGTVEHAIQHTQDTGLKGRRFDSIEEQNKWLMHWEEVWASKRIHGRMKRQVEQMFQEEKPYLSPLPLKGFDYFRQESRKVYDDGTIQVEQSYYSALPAPLHQDVIIRIYEYEIEIIDPRTMEKIRTHVKSHRAGTVKMEPEDRIFNPSRQTKYLLGKAESIGPHTKKLCELIFGEQGRVGQRRLQGIVNLARKHEAANIESAAGKAIDRGLRSYKSFCRLVKTQKPSADTKTENSLSQEHKLIRSSNDYGEFFNNFAAKAGNDPIISQEDLPQVWQNADWLKAMAAFGLESQKHKKNNEIWIKSPFTGEKNASLHMHLGQNVYKDFSSGKGGGILNFCQDLLGQQGQVMNCYQVAAWMLEKGISVLNKETSIDRKPVQKQSPPKENRNVEVDLRPFFKPGHPAFEKRGISKKACQYLGCGYLPERVNGNKSPLNGRLVFQVRGISQDLKPEILSHVGRALTDRQSTSNGRYWAFPFSKGLEIYNQDKLLLDPLAREQVERFGLVLVEGFFDVAALVSAGCFNAGALMGSHITVEQVLRLKFLASHMAIRVIHLFMDRDEAGQKGSKRAVSLLKRNGFAVKEFDWDQKFDQPGCPSVGISSLIKDPADMSGTQIKYLRKHGII